jgi:hypothetical protein
MARLVLSRDAITLRHAAADAAWFAPPDPH